MSEQTRIISTDDDTDLRSEQRTARDRSLGKVEQPEHGSFAYEGVQKRTTDRFHGALGLFLLRLVTATVLGVHGVQKLTNHQMTTDFFKQVGLPSPSWMAWGIGGAEVLAAFALVFGIVTRLTGVCVAALAIGALVLVKWGHANPILPGIGGFSGEVELLLAAAGLMFFLLGAGRWSVDGSFRAGRQEARSR